MIFGGLPMISLCHQAILDRRLAGSDQATHSVGVDLAVRNYSSNSSATTMSPWNHKTPHDEPQTQPQRSKVESVGPDSGPTMMLEFGSPPIPFWERFQANLLTHLISLKVIRRVEDIEQ
jgi:hypothetical protein